MIPPNKQHPVFFDWTSPGQETIFGRLVVLTLLFFSFNFFIWAGFLWPEARQSAGRGGGGLEGWGGAPVQCFQCPSRRLRVLR